MKRRIILSLVLAVLVGVSLVTPTVAVTIDYVPIGNAGNAAGGPGGYGSVGYTYRIAKNETTNAQYAEFLNAVAKTDTYGLYSTSMTGQWINSISRGGVSGAYSYTVNPGSENKPIACVSWFDAARFCNWVQNGQPTGLQSAATTEDGAYTLNGATSGIIPKNMTAAVYIPSESEWYKAAYYDPNKGGASVGGYWLYPTQSDTMTSNDIGVAGAANYYDTNGGGYAVYTGSGAGAWVTNDVGAYGANSDSAYGTNDQGGNVFEWNDAVIDGSSRVVSGGSWGNFANALYASSHFDHDPSDEYEDIGFRVANVPEPVIFTHPASVAINQGRRVTFSVTARGDTLTYQWQKNTVDIPDEDGVTLVLNNVQAADQGDYRVVVSNTIGSVTSNQATLTVYPDTDGDGLTDAEEVNIYHTDPNKADTDNDGLSDYVEIFTYGTNPAKSDTDGDGFDDLFEINTGFNPILATSTPDLLSSIRTAVEFRFNAATGVSYRIEASTDLDAWDIIEPVIIGQSAVVTRFYSTENMPKRYFRVRKN